MSLLGGITPPNPRGPPFASGSGLVIRETASGEHHKKLKSCLFWSIGFSVTSMEHSTRMEAVRVKGGHLAVPSQGFKHQQIDPLGFKPLPAPPTQVS